MNYISITEAPRDALQGIHTFIPTEKKVAYLRSLLDVGFAQLDCVSFVSAKVIPQLRDSAAVLEAIAPWVGKNQLLAIIGNLRGAEEACQQPTLRSLGYPLSLSETFQQRNTRRSIETALDELQNIEACCQETQKKLLVFLSMGFGNPYGDKYDEDVLLSRVERLQKLGTQQISIADTVGLATPRQIEKTFSLLQRQFPEAAIGVHLHTHPKEARDKAAAAYQAGCRYFDSTMHGYGGCPTAADQLIGNLSTETLISYLESQGEPLKLNKKALQAASSHAHQLLSGYEKSVP